MKIKITYTAAEAETMKKAKARLLELLPLAKVHDSKVPGGIEVCYIQQKAKMLHPAEGQKHLK